MLASFGLLVHGGGHVWYFLLVTLGVAFSAALLAVREFGRVKAAALIIENQIMHIQPAVIKRSESSEAHLASGSIEVFVSGFGILLDSTVIVFNQGAVRLLAVEMGQESILMKYGTDNEQHSITLLCKSLDEVEFEAVSRKFRYETGITPSRGGIRLE
ncbi:MAG: hypothetical protein KGZ66_09645 [Selenomonadales bacterium]|nr:hypothetical protein [Selenomonadales bacterium]